MRSRSYSAREEKLAANSVTLERGRSMPAASATRSGRRPVIGRRWGASASILNAFIPQKLLVGRP